MSGHATGGVNRLHVGGFGDALVASITPAIQVDAVYGILPSDFETFVDAGASGSITEQDSVIRAATGVAVGGYGVCRTRRSLRYRPGQTARARFAGFFTQGVADSLQIFGLSSQENTLAFAFNGASFGVLRRQGLAEIRRLTIGTPAAGAETVTVTLNGVAYGGISVTAGTAAQNAFEIASDAQFGPTQAWIAFQNGDTVTFLANTIGPQSGAYSVASTGALAGSFAQLQGGAANVDDFIAQADWDRQPFAGFDPTLGNVYEVAFQWLGYGNIQFKILNPATGYYETVHTIRYPNTSNVQPSVRNPAMQLACIAASLGSTTNLVCGFSSMGGFYDGQRIPFRNPRGFDNEKAAIGATLTNVLTIRNTQVFRNKVNFDEILPAFVNFAADSASGNAPIRFEVIADATLGGTPNWTSVDANDSRVETDVAGTTVTGGALVAGAAVPSSGQVTIDLTALRDRIAPFETLTLAASRSSGTADVIASVTWNED